MGATDFIEIGTTTLRTWRGVVPGKHITVYDDFAHHPSAIATTLDGLRRKVGPAPRIVCMSNGGFGGIHEKLLGALA